MCVLLCANPQVHEWLDMTVARAARQSLRLWALLPPDPFAAADSETADELDERAVQQLARGPKLRQPGWSRMHNAGRRFALDSSHERHKPLDALANAWSRLLVLVGWRR